MSRFDDFAKSSARGRGLFGAFRSAEAEVTESGISRRDLMKKAGIVGGATIAGSALIQSVGAPAHAASCPVECPTGSICNNVTGQCVPAAQPRIPCPNSGLCTSGCCAGAGEDAGFCMGGAPMNSPCSRDVDCCSRKCGSGGVCLRPQGTNCANDSECASGLCNPPTVPTQPLTRFCA